jgi:hypothetical protein
MSAEPKAKINDDPDAMPWGAFFHKAFEDLKIRTGLNQWENLSATETGKEQARKLIGAMIIECKNPPFDKVRKSVIQRVLSNAVIQDRPFDQNIDFTGYSVKWVRSVLNAWWAIYGDKIIQEWNRTQDEEAAKNKPMPFMNPHLNVDDLVTQYIKSLKMPSPPQMSEAEIKKEGKEWTSKFEGMKASGYNNGLTVEQFQFRERLQRAASNYYVNKQSFSLKPFEVNETTVYAESEKDAIEIYTIALKKD